MDWYPKELSERARALVELEELNASRDLDQERSRVTWSQYGPGEEDEKNLRTYILRIFRVFARQACELGAQGTWEVDRIRSQADEFLRRLTINAFYTQGHDSTGRQLHVPNFTGNVSSELWRKYVKSIQWYQFEDDLIAVAGLQAQGATQSCADGFGLSIIGRLPYDALARIEKAMTEFVGENMPSLKLAAANGEQNQEAADRQFFDELVTHAYHAVSRECLDVCESVAEFKNALRSDIPRFVRRLFNLHPWPDSMRGTLDEAAASYESEVPMPELEGLASDGEQFDLDNAAGLAEPAEEGHSIPLVDLLGPEIISKANNRVFFEWLKHEYRQRGKKLTLDMLTQKAGYEGGAPRKSNTEAKAWLRGKPRSGAAARSFERAFKELKAELFGRPDELS
jgi:hypothetical protein